MHLSHENYISDDGKYRLFNVKNARQYFCAGRFLQMQTIHVIDRGEGKFKLSMESGNLLQFKWLMVCCLKSRVNCCWTFLQRWRFGTQQCAINVKYQMSKPAQLRMLKWVFDEWWGFYKTIPHRDKKKSKSAKKTFLIWRFILKVRATLSCPINFFLRFLSLFMQVHHQHSDILNYAAQRI